MGYIFDAMNRASGGPPPDGDGKPGKTGQPVKPTQPAKAAVPPAPIAPLAPAAPAPVTDAAREAAPVASRAEGLARPRDFAEAPTPLKFNTAPLETPSAIAASPVERMRKPLNFTGPGRVVSEEDLAGIDDRLVALTEPASLMAEEYRSIRTGMLARWQQRRNLVHTITSATPQEGKTITSLNLGLSFSELRNRRTIVVEADLRLPQFEKLLGLPQHSGLVHVLEGEAELRDSIQEVGPYGLHVLTAGRSVNDHAVQLLSSPTAASLVARLREKYDHVIFDTPPVLEMADAGILGSMSDDVMLVARLERTPRDLVERAVRTLANYNAPAGGVIATDQKRNRHQHYYKYSYRYTNAAARKVAA